MTSLLGGGGAAKAASAASAAAERRATLAQKAQEAAQARATINEDKRAEQLSAQNSTLIRASASRRAGRNALAFLPVASGLKTTLGA